MVVYYTILYSTILNDGVDVTDGVCLHSIFGGIVPGLHTGLELVVVVATETGDVRCAIGIGISMAIVVWAMAWRWRWWCAVDAGGGGERFRVLLVACVAYKAGILVVAMAMAAMCGRRHGSWIRVVGWWWRVCLPVDGWTTVDGWAVCMAILWVAKKRVLRTRVLEG